MILLFFQANGAQQPPHSAAIILGGCDTHAAVVTPVNELTLQKALIASFGGGQRGTPCLAQSGGSGEGMVWSECAKPRRGMLVGAESQRALSRAALYPGELLLHDDLTSFYALLLLSA